MTVLKDVTFSYGKKQILNGFSMELADGEIVSVMGRSGSGKSTLLNLIAGLRKPDSGTITTEAKRISYAFQDARLFPWLTVKENIFAVFSDKIDREARADEVLDAVGLTDAASLFPRELSGGMKSRASLARALAYGGNLYLLDEPFAALDEESKQTLLPKIRDRIRANGASAIFVTHQEDEAKVFADRIVSME